MKKQRQHKPTDTIKIMKIFDQKTAFLFRDMFPVSENYIYGRYVKGGQPVRVADPKQIQELEKNARKIINLLRRGVRFTPTQPDVIRIEKIMLEELRDKKITYRKALKDDANLLIDIYNASFYDDYVRYGMCPAYGKTKEEMESSIEASIKYIVLFDTVPVGAISLFEEKKGYYYLGCLCVIPEYQGKGIGTQAFQYILSVCPDWKQITLVTPVDKEQNIKFYTERCGFHIGEKMMDGKVEVVNFYMKR